LANAPTEALVDIAFFDGAETRALRPMHIDLKGSSGRATALVITVATF